MTKKLIRYHLLVHTYLDSTTRVITQRLRRYVYVYYTHSVHFSHLSWTLASITLFDQHTSFDITIEWITTVHQISGLYPFTYVHFQNELA